MKVLIADDEPLARDRLRALLVELGDIELVGEAGNGREAVELAAQLRPDVMLLDIAMPVLDGLEAARHVAGFEHPPAVIFCTAFDQHALSAFEAAAVDYLVKPVRAERLAEALQRARRMNGADRHDASVAAGGRNTRRTHLCARLRGTLRLIPVADVHYLQAEEKYVVVHHARGEDLIEDSLKALETEFGDRFLRIHRGCLVARDEFVELKRAGGGQVQAVLRHAAAPLEVSRRCVASLREQLKAL